MWASPHRIVLTGAAYNDEVFGNARQYD